MIRKDYRSKFLKNYIETGVWICSGLDQLCEKLRVCYLDNYNLDEWGPLVQDPENLCFDLKVAEPEYVNITPHEAKIVRLGVIFDLPKTMGLNVFPRSSLGPKIGLMLTNHVGKIDPGYRGELMAHLYNFTGKNVKLEPGERIVQAEIVYRVGVGFETITREQLSETKRGVNGFGSTGRV